MRDGVWTRGEDTELEAWIGGTNRVVVVTRSAIEHHLALGGDEAAAMSADERRRFVRDNVSLIVAAANRKIVADKPDLEPVSLGAGEL